MHIRIATSKDDVIDHFHVRGVVFIQGQDIAWDIEVDGLDKDCVLFNAYIKDQIVGAARLYHNKVGRVATLIEFRKQGVASALMAFIEDYARNNHIPTLVLHAQLSVRDFYLHRGYIEDGDIFQEADIDHVKMKKQL